MGNVKTIRDALAYGGAVLALMLVMVLPFMMNRRVGPQTGFLIESTSTILALVMVLGVAVVGCFRSKPPLVSVMLLAMALWMVVQARWLQLDWLSQVDLAALIVVVAALSAWALQAWQQHSRTNVFEYVAWGLVIGVLLQTGVMWLQYFGLTQMFKGYVSYSQTTNIMGQLGQRNHLGHYLMWGMMAVLYLQHRRVLNGILSMALVGWLGLSIGLVGSRTLITYLMVIGLLACVWRVRVGRSWHSQFYWVMAALAWVVAVQFGLEKVLSVFSDAAITTGVERLTKAPSVVDPARNVEWLKAWQAFLSSPWWGHGWGSGASQSFWMHSDALLSRRAEVLFTHSHNGVLQLLMELGAIGSVWVFGCLAVLACRCFKYAKRPESFAILAMVSVSLCHSMLEYPLWYVYFLLPFVLFLALVPHNSEKNHTDYVPAINQRLNGLVGVVALVLLLGSVRLLFAYQDIVSVYGVAKNEMPEVAAQKKAQINGLLEREYLLDYYVRMALLERSFNAYQGLSVASETDNARLAAQYRPYPSYAVRWGMYQYRLGEREAATQWLEQVWRSYPAQLDASIKAMANSPYHVDLLPIAKARCLQYQLRIKIKCSFTDVTKP